MSASPIEQWASTVVLGDGDTALIRPLTTDDKVALLEFHERQSLESKYRRFFSAKPSLSERELEHFTNVDFVNRVALAVERHGEFIGWASYERWPNRDDAEAAFMVDDDHQGKGIATLLLEHLAAIARSNGITRFTAEVLADNRAMLAVFGRAGWPLQRRFDSGVIDVDFDLDSTREFIDSVERREQRADSRAMARLLLPRSMAIVGASDVHGSIGRALWRNSTDFAGRRYAVNPGHATVAGERSYASLRDIAEEVALAVIAVPQHHLEAVIDDCIAMRVRGAVVVTAVDDPAIDVGELVRRSRRNGLRLIGPASMGFASPRDDVGIQAALVPVQLPAGGVAISMQSGTLGGSLLRLADRLQLGVSWFVSLGDKSDVSGNDLLQFWLDDDATKVIALYTESVGNPRKFARIARRVSQQRPIVAVRTGTALIGPGTGALYQQAGLIEVPTVAAMLDTARVMATQPMIAGPRVAVLANSRSPGVLAGAAIEAAGMQTVDPPVALDWRSSAPDYEHAVRAALTDDGVDAVLVIHAPPVMSAVNQPVDEIDRAVEGCTKPVVAVMLGAEDGPLRPGSNVPAFGFPEPAAAVLGRLHSYWRWRTTEADSITSTPAGIDVAAATTAIANALDEGREHPRFDELHALLHAYGVQMADARLVARADALTAADEVGYPVAVKASRRHVGRSVRAGVALDLDEPDDVAAAISIMEQHLGDDAAEVVVQHMVPPGVDARIHITTDARLGPVVTVGMGGVHAELIGDESSRLAPVSYASAATMTAATRLGGAFGDDDIERFVDVVVRVAQLASDHPELVELDLNPVIVGEGECWVTDARATLAHPQHAEAALRRLE